MTGILAQVRGVVANGEHYDAIMVWCPGCQYDDPEDGHPRGGLHMLPISLQGTTDTPRPTWGWNGDLVKVSLTPSILTRVGRGEDQAEHICHSYLTDGIWQFLGDCTHDMANQHVPMVELPDWAVKE